MKERIVIVFIAVALGLFVTTVGYLLYQQTKVIPKNLAGTTTQIIVTPTLADKYFLSVEEPTNESISSKRTVVVKGKTNPENTLVVSTNQEDQVATPTRDGSFSITTAIDTGVNKIVTRSIAPDGEEKIDTRILTFSQEDF
ncbi:MAG: hypothetical protein COX79_05120 [Candidatus Levybacteria bacterium CG_4_10_14_0_2_um_filter_36_16]|nr:MAG: hypothetical protein AUK12_04240 [Candidatus Levybacteria bacterium CG2_30_37_29]PIZ96509.1 MAG: hypothetical protein COX79_05120 [Candidatus Levybacteria bacterium CG_4_10_14_0_2_um_filter_36_16]PJA90645.1 MAG: hypothetical protein CO136_01350 [Candidatus Levybacteria bacterium CG_4_9_14_3_um_filter_36_7]